MNVQNSHNVLGRLVQRCWFFDRLEPCEQRLHFLHLLANRAQGFYRFGARRHGGCHGS